MLCIYTSIFFVFSSNVPSSELDKCENEKDTTTELNQTTPMDNDLKYHAVNSHSFEATVNECATSDVPSSKKLSNFLSSPVAITPVAKKPRFSFPSTSPETSCYFSQTKSNSESKFQENRTSIVKARVSGLLKKKDSQPNLLQMWSKLK